MTRSGVRREIRIRGIADDDLLGVGNGDDRGHQVETVFAGNDDRLIALHEGDERVGGAEIDSDDAGFCHGSFDAF